MKIQKEDVKPHKRSSKSIQIYLCDCIAFCAILGIRTCDYFTEFPSIVLNFKRKFNECARCTRLIGRAKKIHHDIAINHTLFHIFLKWQQQKKNRKNSNIWTKIKHKKKTCNSLEHANKRKKKCSFFSHDRRLKYSFLESINWAYKPFALMHTFIAKFGVRV